MSVSIKTTAIAYPDKFLAPEEVSVIAAIAIASSMSKDNNIHLTAYGALVSGTSGDKTIKIDDIKQIRIDDSIPYDLIVDGADE